MRSTLEAAQRDALFWPLRRAFEALPSNVTDAPLTPDHYGRALDALVNSVEPRVRFEVMRKPRRRPPRPPPARSYDGRISSEGVVPSRPNNLHDFLNALVWATFPKAKRALHVRQYQAAALHGNAANRSRDQDRLTQLDEGGIVIACTADRIAEATSLLCATPEPNAGALARLDWLSVALFGHALYEHLLTPSRSIRGYVVLLGAASLPPADAERVHTLDAALARALENGVPKATGAARIGVDVEVQGCPSDPTRAR